MPKYTVKSPLKYDGKEYAVGAPVEMDERTAATLAGVVEAATEKTPPAGPTDPAQRLETIKAAITRLDKDDKAQWTKGGSPHLDALEAILGWRPNALERDQAFTEMQPDAPTE